MQNLFHLAFPVKDLQSSREFYGEVLGCEEGRSSEHWIDFNLFGHQIVAHLAPEAVGVRHKNEVDADHVPVPHFGIVLPPDEFHALAERSEIKGCGIRHRTENSLCRRNRRTGDDVFSRPVGKRARI